MDFSDSRSNAVTAEKVEERSTPTTVHAVFVLPPLSPKSKYDSISVGLPLANLGWTFALSLSPKYHKKPVSRGRDIKSGKYMVIDTWNPVALAFHNRGRVIPWGNTCMHAELSLTTDLLPSTASDSPPLDVSSDGLSLANDAPLPCASVTFPCPTSNSTVLGTMEKIALAHSHSLEIKLAPHALSLFSPSKISLALTISDCPFSRGFFHVTSGGADAADAQKWLAKQCSERLLSRSLTTGRVYDVKFLACSAHPASGSNESLLGTHAWLSVLEGHVDPPLARLREEWSNALTAPSSYANPDVKCIVEIPCPDGYEYELDSDYDEDENFEPVTLLSPGEHDAATLQGEESDSTTEGHSSPFSSFERDRVSDTTPFDFLHEEFTKGQGVHSSSKTIAECERTVVIKFAAHRTWHAFLWYCYTGHIEFCELKSQVGHGVRRLRVVGDGPPSCSPKSMYRLADLVGDKDLKDLALNAIKERMIKTNVLEETFSVFTSTYPDVLKAQLDVLVNHRASPEAKKELLGKILKCGVMPHAEPALEAFYDRLAAMEPQ